MTQCTQKEFKFQVLKQGNSKRDKKVIGAFNGGSITSDAGGLLLKEVEAKTGILRQFAKCFHDHRNPAYIEHTVQELISQRIYGLALGYEDLNDHDDLRADPLLATLSGKEDPTGSDRIKFRDKGNPLAGKSTLNRLELTPADAGKDNRYKKIVYEQQNITDFFVDIFLQRHKKEPEQIIIDLDATDDLIHGMQEGRFFHGYYGNYCYLPLYIFCGDFILSARLRTSDRDGADGATEDIARIVNQIRKAWKDVRIILRADSGFAREKLMSWSEDNGVDYVFGLAKNQRLKKMIERDMEQAQRIYKEEGIANRRYKDLEYQTLKTWTTSRRVVAKAEYLAKGSNPRFIVTSLNAEEYEKKYLYEEVYCARGDMENRIKEQQLYLFADRTSARTMRANQLRLWLSSVAYMLVSELRRIGLKGTDLAKAQCQTIRNKILKIGAQVRVSIRRVLVSFASGYPYQKIFQQAYNQLRL